MLTIEWTNQFKRDFKREIKGRHRLIIQQDLSFIAEKLASNQELETKYRDHAMTGNWIDCRNCHIKPDLILIYREFDNILQLIRLGSHSELGI